MKSMNQSQNQASERTLSESASEWAVIMKTQIIEQQCTIEQLTANLNALSTAIRASVSDSFSSSDQVSISSSHSSTTIVQSKRHLPDLSEFHENKTDFLAWLSQMNTKLEIDKADDTEFVHFWYLHSQLRGHALSQITSWVKSIRTCADVRVRDIIAQLHLVYKDSQLTERVTQRLNSLRQGKKKSFADYSTRFDCTLLKAEDLLWTDQMKRTFLINRLSMELRRALVTTSLSALYKACCSVLHSVSVSLKLLHRQKQRLNNFCTRITASSEAQNANQMNWEPASAIQVMSTQIKQTVWVSERELKWQRETEYCFWCEQTNHWVKNCKLLSAVHSQAGVNAILSVTEVLSSEEESGKD